MGGWVRLVAATTVTLMYFPSANAAPLQCSEFGLSGIQRPEKPSCYTLPFQGDEATFSMCESEMSSYKSKMREYLDCLRAESTEAVDEYNSAVRSFNCNAQGTFC